MCDTKEKIISSSPSVCNFVTDRYVAGLKRLNPALILCLLSVSLCCSCMREKKTRIYLHETKEIQETDTLQERQLVIGVAAMLSPEYALPAYEKLVKYIGEKMDVPARMLFTRDYASMNEMVRNRKVIGAFVCSGPYVTAHDEWGMEIIAVPSLYGSSSYYSYIIVNDTSGFETMDELQGKKFAFTDPESNTGKLAPTYELALRHVSPESFFSEYSYTGSHDKSIEAVAEGFADGAAVDNLIWEYMSRTDPEYTSRTRVIAKLGPYCNPPFVTYPDCDPAIKEKLKSILLGMEYDPEGKAILSMIFIDRFVEVNDDCYRSIRVMNDWIKREYSK